MAVIIERDHIIVFKFEVSGLLAACQEVSDLYYEHIQGRTLTYLVLDWSNMSYKKGLLEHRFVIPYTHKEE